jgi:hypothetical protein
VKVIILTTSTRRTQMPFEAFILLAIIMIMLPVAYDELFKGGK